MRHHLYNPDFQFDVKPVDFTRFTEKATLQYCLGATLYMPGTKIILEKILNKSFRDVTSIVMCFEDAIMEKELEAAEINVISHLTKIAEGIDRGTISHEDVPLIFLRVRNTEQFRNFSKRLHPTVLDVLSGFVFPKFYSYNANEYLQVLDSLNRQQNVRLFGMPILEGRSIAMLESRINELGQLLEILNPYKEWILNIRVGGTDFSSLFGVRRGINYSIYDILTIRDCLSDILNFFSRVEEEYVVSGPVWEYFLAHKKDDLQHLLDEDIHRSLLTRNPILNDAIDGLLREVMLDKANGFVGKTIIHPSHARFVNALQAVTLEEYEDAMQILDKEGGVVKSSRANKMNERNPHKSWAQKVISRAKAYGVIKSEASYLKLFAG